MPQKECNGTRGIVLNNYAYFVFMYETTYKLRVVIAAEQRSLVGWLALVYTGVMGDKVSLQYNVIKILSRIKPLPLALCEFILSLTAVTARFLGRVGVGYSFIIPLLCNY